MKKTLLLLFLACSAVSPHVQADDRPFTLNEEFSYATKGNLEGYLKPAFTTIAEGQASSLFTSINLSEEFRVGLDINYNVLIIPDSQRSFSAKLPDSYSSFTRSSNAKLESADEDRDLYPSVDQPTIYGGQATPIFSAEKSDTNAKSVVFLSGNDRSWMPTIPAIGLSFNLPSQTELRFRYAGFSFDESTETEVMPGIFVPDTISRSTSFFTVSATQQLDDLLEIFENDTNIMLGVNVAYSSISVSGIYESSVFSMAAIGEYAADEMFSLTGFLQFEATSGELNVVREAGSEITDSPYEELRDPENVDFSMDAAGENSLRFGVGAHGHFGPLVLSATAALATQPVFTLGGTIWFN